MRLPFRRSRRGLHLPGDRILHGGGRTRRRTTRRALRGEPPPAPTFDAAPREIDAPPAERFPVAEPAEASRPRTIAPAAPPLGGVPSDRGFSLLPHALPDRVSDLLGRCVAATGLTPNMLTLLGLAGTVGAAALAAHGLFWQAGAAMLAASAFDLLDGAVARATGRATTWGAIFDAVSDRLGEFAMFLGLLVWFTAADNFDREAVVLIGVSIGGAMLVSYTRSKAGEYGVRIREGLGTRFERVVILAIGLFSGEVVAVLWILAVLTNLTALQRWGVTWWALRGYAEPPAEGAAGPHDPDGPARRG
ncbi:MAG: CDP-alcohol phosphatidyltransferase family protein [Chloroflexi bacterium]|nr:CDP-alcohol phosphatidyltransferase family protein [Chloroflexota bacterium]